MPDFFSPSSSMQFIGTDLYSKEELSGAGELVSERYSLDSELFKSYYQCITTPKYQLFNTETNSKRDIALISSGPQNIPLSLNINLGGDFDYCYPQINNKKELWKGNTLNLYSSREMISQSFFHRNEKTRQFAIVFSYDYLTKLSNQTPQLFYSVLNDYENKKTNKIFDNNLLCSPRIIMLTQEIINTDSKDSLFTILLESKILEILYLSLSKDLGEINKLYFHEKEKIIEARNILYNLYQNPPSICRLASMIGSNEFKLKQGFRLLYNNTVYGVLSEYRMEKAKQYLLDTQMPVSEIALQIGFEHQSSFCKAFKRQFLMTPVEYRNSR
ncbi:AraC family transcriptional regulator [Dysgonomonas capnocytophagoides]|uniref:AraC family transcriptional regulator n=1 Tax=Dysgonomonas capnocytophagoides TaxID=45254 RepID=A0A4Y8L743_9BACT|nr:AraC family transcriptional regulator [Dysgonomonas capnocytophagoides]TFD96326.1 AraC family transcriptional regulator [Dysgonomonas capnocytophagoides]